MDNVTTTLIHGLRHGSVSGNMSAVDDGAIAMLQTGMFVTASLATPAKSIKK